MQLSIEEKAQREADHILNNQPELYQFFMDNLDAMENMTNVFSANYRGIYKRTKDQLVSQQIEIDVLQKCIENMRLRHE